MAEDLLRAPAGTCEYGRTKGFKAHGLLTWLIWFLLVFLLQALLVRTPAAAYGTAVAHAGGLAWLLLSYWMHKRKRVFGSQLFASASPKAWAMGGGAIAALYLAAFAYRKVMDVPREAYMQLLYVGKSPTQVAVFLASVCILVPIAEELAFRYFLRGAFPYKRSNRWRSVAVVATSFIFTVGHMQYQHAVTLILMFLVACVLAEARIASGGLLVPIVLHSEAALMALVLNEVS